MCKLPSSSEPPATASRQLGHGACCLLTFRKIPCYPHQYKVRSVMSEPSLTSGQLSALHPALLSHLLPAGISLLPSGLRAVPDSMWPHAGLCTGRGPSAQQALTFRGTALYRPPSFLLQVSLRPFLRARESSSPLPRGKHSKIYGI